MSDWPIQVPPRVTALPTGAQDGQEILYLADSTNGVVWHLKYRAGSSSSYKWEFVGGPSLSAEVTTDETTTSGTFGNLATVGPSVALPLAGDYDIDIGTVVYISGTLNTTQNMSYAIGGTAAVTADQLTQTCAAAGNVQEGMRARRKTGLTAVTLTAKYLTGGGGGTTAHFLNRWMRATPVRVG